MKLRDVKRKFDTVIEGYNLLSGKIDRLAPSSPIVATKILPLISP